MHTTASDWGALPSPCPPPLCPVLQCLGVKVVSTHRFWGRINLKTSPGFWRLAVRWGEQQQPMPSWLSWLGSLRLVGGQDWVTWQKSQQRQEADQYSLGLTPSLGTLSVSRLQMVLTLSWNVSVWHALFCWSQSWDIKADQGSRGMAP